MIACDSLFLFRNNHFFTTKNVVRIYCLSFDVSSSQPQQFLQNDVEFSSGLLVKLKLKSYYFNVISDSHKKITYPNERYENVSGESVIFFKKIPTDRVSIN